MDKVKITAHYVSYLGTEQTESWEVDTTEQAKNFIETRVQDFSKPKYTLTATTIEEEGFQYDVSRFEQFNFSYVEVVDYTDGKEISKEQK